MVILKKTVKLQKRTTKNTKGNQTKGIVAQIQIPKDIIQNSNMNKKGILLNISLCAGGRKIVIEKA